MVILATAATRTKTIRLTSAVTVLSAADPVRVFLEFGTLDLIARGRVEIVVGRGSSVEAYPLFGYDLADYDALFAKNLDLLLALRENTQVEWSGRFRAPLRGQGVFPLRSNRCCRCGWASAAARNPSSAPARWACR